MTIAALMTPDPVTCHETDSVNDAARKMWDHDIGALPVVDDEHRPIGMITDRDACMAAYTQGRPLAAIPVHSAMARSLVTISIHADLERVVHAMQTHQVRRIPVVDDEGRLRGIVSLHDLAWRSGTGRGATISEQVVAATLRAVCSHRRLPARRDQISIAVGS